MQASAAPTSAAPAASPCHLTAGAAPTLSAAPATNPCFPTSRVLPTILPAAPFLVRIVPCSPCKLSLKSENING